MKKSSPMDLHQLNADAYLLYVAKCKWKTASGFHSDKKYLSN